MWLFSNKGESGFSSSSTAEQVTDGIDASGLTAIVTGASSGIGKETARVLALRGVHVVMAVRDMDAGRKAKNAIVEAIPKAQGIGSRVDGVGEEVCIRIQFYGPSIEHPHICVLTASVGLISNNAGIMATPFTLSKDNIELQFATNHIGHFLLTNLLLETMKRTAIESKKEGRIVNVSSRRHKLSYHEGIRFDKINDESSYNSLSAYGQSKLANVLHANELARRLKEDRIEITSNSVHPGAIATNLFRHYGLLSGLVDTIGKYVLKNVEQGAATTCYAALHPQVKGTSGKYFADSNMAKTSLHAEDADLAKKLWDFSMSLLK